MSAAPSSPPTKPAAAVKKKIVAAPSAGGGTDKKTDAPLPRSKQIPQHQVAITIEDAAPAPPAPTAPPVLVPARKKISIGALTAAIASIEPALWIACSFLVTIALGAGAPREARWLRVLSALAALVAEAYFLFAMVLWKNYAAAAGSQRWLMLVGAVALAFVANFLFLYPYIFQ